MPNKIIILPDSVSNKIAAGEVIERPASVLKELLENSLDAGASNINILIESAGIKLISVADDGCGMSPDDSLLCIEPHATSKLSTAEDLNNISTFGFRGEALPSIASVSKFRLRTRNSDAEEGSEIYVDGGKIIEAKPVGCAKGTEISVRELFFNVPARRKFLHSLQTEEKHIIELIYTIAIANFAVSFNFHCDGKNIFRSPASETMKPRIIEFFGKSYMNGLTEVEYEESGIEIYGFTAKHGITRASRREQRIFVNGRPAESPVVFAAIKDAYASIIPAGRYPPVILFIKTNPIRVDVNVHPAKKEVRFREPALFRNAIEKAIREALRNSQSSSVNLSSQIPLKQLLNASLVNYDADEKEKKRNIENNILPGLEILPQQKINELATEEKTSQTPKISTQISTEERFPHLRIIGNLDSTYILASCSDGLVIIDQHAAHERILFEKILSASQKKDEVFQKLLIPVTIELSGAEIQFITKNSDEFKKLGFEFENFGGNTVIVRSIPIIFQQDNVVSLIHDIIDRFSSEGLAKATPVDIAKKACKFAVKAHDDLKTPEIENLIQQLSSCEMPFCCPHGRPTIINISHSELKRRFGRT